MAWTIHFSGQFEAGATSLSLDELHHTMEWFSTYDIASSYSTKL